MLAVSEACAAAKESKLELRGISMRSRSLFHAFAGAALAAAIPVCSAAGDDENGSGADRLARINRIVIIYQENHSFDNVYGG